MPGYEMIFMLLLALQPASSTSLLRLRGGSDDSSAALAAKEKLSAWFSKATVANKVLDPDHAKAVVLLKKRGVSNASQAAELLRRALRRDPDNPQLKLELADALNMICRIKTNANSLIIEGVQESPAFKKIWRDLGSEALPLATEARKAMPNDVKALAVYADSFLYCSSSKGVRACVAAAVRSCVLSYPLIDSSARFM